jgi:hypothetical protein
MTSDEEHFTPDVLAEALTIWASPGLVTDAARPDLGSVPAQTAVPALSVHTRDEHPGAELIDVIASALLGQGFELLAAFDPATLVDLPILAGWAVELGADGRHLTVIEPTAVFYEGDLGAAVPSGWQAAVHRRGMVVLLVSSDIDLAGSRPVASMDAARRAGSVVGAQIPARWR